MDILDVFFIVHIIKAEESMIERSELLDCFIQQLSPGRVYLFGSYADGTFHKDSDFDFYIVVDDRQTDLIELMRQAYKSIRSVKNVLLTF